MIAKSKQREKPIPEDKIRKLQSLVELLKKSKSVMIVSIKSIPGNQFQIIKKKLRGKANIKVVKKSLGLRALKEAGLEKLSKHVHEDIALLFSELDTFELSAILSENQSPAKAKTGQEALEDIVIHAGATDLPPGPAISELSGVGLKVKIEEGKIAIQEDKVIVKKGEKISEAVANVLGKLSITPFKVGFIPEVAYQNGEIYEEIKIDKEEALDELKSAANKAFAFAVKIGYICKETISALIRKAGAEEKALEKFVKEKNGEEKQGNVEQSEEAGKNKELTNDQTQTKLEEESKT